MTITMRCPVCHLGGTFRARTAPTITCNHPNTIHDAKKPALMVVVATNEKVPA